MSATRPAVVRFYVDADVLGFAKVVCGLRSDFTYPGDPGAVIHRRVRPPCPVTSPATGDSEWLSTTARAGWLAITRDHNIRVHRKEIEAVRRHGARLVALAGSEAANTWTQLEMFLCQWRAVERLLGQPGPFIYSLTRTALRSVELT